MSYLWDQVPVLYGGRLQHIGYRSDRAWPGEDVDLQILGALVWLEPGQHVPVEQDFLSSHVPFDMAALGGMDREGTPWLLELQAVPTAVVLDAFGLDADPAQVMRDALNDALELNQAAQVGAVFSLDRRTLTAAYTETGIDPEPVRSWSSRDLVRGLLAQAVGAGLEEIVAGYPECAFPEQPRANRTCSPTFSAHGRGAICTSAPPQRHPRRTHRITTLQKKSPGPTQQEQTRDSWASDHLQAIGPGSKPIPTGGSPTNTPFSTPPAAHRFSPARPATSTRGI